MKLNSGVRGRSKYGRFIAGVAIAGFLIGYAPVAASAGDASSSWGYYTINGVQYRNQATISTVSGRASAWTNVGTTSGCASSGWMGLRARLFNSAGSLIQESTIAYNSGCTSLMDRVTTRYAGGAWFSYGVTWGWTGSSYSPSYTYQSPNQSS